MKTNLTLLAATAAALLCLQPVALAQTSASNEPARPSADAWTAVQCGAVTPSPYTGTLLDSFVFGSYTAAESSGLSFAAVSGIISASEVDTSRTKGLKTYEKLARLSGTGAVATTDTWNIQGWLSSRSAVKGSGNSQTNIFSMSLGYYAPVQSGATARYSGDISSWAWTQNGQTPRAYAFTYDGAHRLTAGQYYNNGTATNALSEKAITYDRAGNITSLTRYNNSGTGTTLSYSYTGNRRSSYSYDVNGNATSDATNNLQSSYNLINLPAQIKSGNTVKANYTYLSDGTKAAAYTSANAGRDYAGSFTYTRGSGGAKTLESVAFGGGRIRRTGTNSYAVDYYITDHLGSVRAIVNASGTIQEQNDYYPFGTRHSISGQPTLSGNRWRFAGKEEQDVFGIAYSDFGARLYDRSAWTAIDPLAEKYYSVSPYSYCHNNPTIYIDPYGLVDWRVTAQGGQTAVSGIASIGVGVGVILVSSGFGGAAGMYFILNGCLSTITGTTKFIYGLIDNERTEDAAQLPSSILELGGLAIDRVSGDENHTAQTVASVLDLVTGVAVGKALNLAAVPTTVKDNLKILNYISTGAQIGSIVTGFLPDQEDSSYNVYYLNGSEMYMFAPEYGFNGMLWYPETQKE